jgi:hypothetical protein
MNASGQKKRLQIHPAGLLIILLGFGAWVVALGGVGSATSNCASGLASNVAPGQSVAVNCAKVYQWQWWGLWFEGCMLVAMFVAVFFEAFNKGKQIVISYLIMCTMILMQGSNYFITNSQLGTGNFSIKSKLQVRAKGQEFGGKCNRTLRLPSLHHSCAASYCPHCACVLTPAWCRCFLLLQVANNAGAAGYTILAVFNFCLLIILGYEPGPVNPPPVRLDEIPMGAV